ncbi:MAG TPA: tetratricopeptide repeat protein [Terriglobia bacterium]|nr:tetratricopeptide repeat protein [Terriglobia bacterium]
MAEWIALSAQADRSASTAKYIFWLGAGISVSAGIPLAEGVVDRYWDKLWRYSILPDYAQPYSGLPTPEKEKRKVTVRRWANESGKISEITNSKVSPMSEHDDWGVLYSDCLGHLPGQLDRQEFILNCIGEGQGRLNIAHVLMAQLVQAGRVTIVLTTNFDDLLLRALQLFLVFPAVIDPDSTKTLMINPRFPQIAYLHGKMTSYRQRHTVNDLHQSIPGLREFLHQVFKDHGLVVVGYHGSDEAPMSILTDVLREREIGPGRGLFWVTLEKEFERLGPSVQTILQLRDTYWLPGHDADDFLRKLCSAPGIGIGLPGSKEIQERILGVLPEEMRAGWNTLFSDTDLKVATVEVGQVTGALPKLAWPGPTRADELVSEGGNLSKAGQHVGAIERYNRALELNSKHPMALFNWGASLLNLGQPEKAIELFARAAELAPLYADIYYVWGSALRAIGRYEEAAVKYQKAVSLNPNDAQALNNWGICLFELQRFREAAERYSQAVVVDPHHAGAFNNWGNALFQLRSPDDAIEKYCHATELNPNLPQPFSNWGYVLLELGKPQEAVEKCNNAIQIDERYAPAHLNLGKALEKLGNHERAQEELRRYVELGGQL